MSAGLRPYPDGGGLRPGLIWAFGRFATNGASDPLISSFAGDLKGFFTVTHAGTGLYTVTLTGGGAVFTFAEAPGISVSNSVANTGAIWTATLTYPTSNAWQNSARQFQINTANQSAPNTPADIAADNRNLITFYVDCIDNTGK
jgi:hypothetical protein